MTTPPFNLISVTADYALRAAVLLVAAHPRHMTVEAIADAAGVPPKYLGKILQTMRRAGLLHSTRGLMGGYRLARPPAEIHALEVIQAVDPIPRHVPCPACTAESLCALHERLADANKTMESLLRSTTLDWLVPQAGGAAGAERRRTKATSR
jgi:Rrf2 family protein